MDAAGAGRPSAENTDHGADQLSGGLRSVHGRPFAAFTIEEQLRVTTVECLPQVRREAPLDLAE